MPTFCLYFPEKNTQLTEFLQQIRSNTDTAALFESVQHDASINPPNEAMDVS